MVRFEFKGGRVVGELPLRTAESLSLSLAHGFPPRFDRALQRELATIVNFPRHLYLYDGKTLFCPFLKWRWIKRFFTDFEPCIMIDDQNETRAGAAAR